MQHNVKIIKGKTCKTAIKRPELGCHYFYHIVQNELELTYTSLLISSSSDLELASVFQLGLAKERVTVSYSFKISRRATQHCIASNMFSSSHELKRHESDGKQSITYLGNLFVNKTRQIRAVVGECAKELM